MPLPDALVATLALTAVLDELAVPYLLAGSLASSYHGIPRSTADADVVAALSVEHAAPLVSRLTAAFYIDLDRARDNSGPLVFYPGGGRRLSWAR